MTTTWLDSLDGLRQPWNELAQNCQTNHPQYLYDWVEPWWRLVGSRKHSLFSMRLDSGDRIVAIAPLMLARRRARGLVTLRQVQWLTTGPTDQHDLISADSAREAGVAVGDQLIRSRRSWDELHLECVPEASEAVQGLLDRLQGGLKCVVRVKRAPSYYIDTSGDWDAYLSTTSKKFVRRDLPRVRRRLAEQGELVISHDREVDVDDLLAVAAAVHRARQDELGRGSGLADERYAAFVAEALEGLKQMGMLSVWTLHVGKDIGAYLIGFETGGVFYAWNMAHNPAYSAVSPGKALWASAIQGCFEDEAIDEFNMMRGDTEYKLKWTSASRDLLDVRVRNLSTFRSALLNRMRRSAG
jgi:CelD/BcsL family acetyltransferase involved in cellulose biosynthesis